MSDAGQAAAGANGGPQTGGQQQSGNNASGAAGAASGTGAFDWSGHGLDADTSSYVTAKGWKGPGDVVASYRGIEKLMGVPADQVIKLPQGTDITPEQWNTNVYDRLGRPKEVAEYKPHEWVPQGGDAKFAEAAAGWFHEQGLNPRQAKALATKWNEYSAGMQKTVNDGRATKDAAEVAALKSEWGNNFDGNSQLVDKAAEQFGMNPAQIGALKEAMGPAAAMKFLHNIGAKMGTSDSFVRSDASNPSFYGGMSPDQAKQEIATLKADKGFMQKYTHGDADAKKRFTELHQRAYPGTKQL